MLCVLQLYISRIYSVYCSLELVLSNIKSTLIVLVLLHTLFSKSLCLFGTLDIYLVCPFKRLSEYRCLILCDLDYTRRNCAYAYSSVNAYLRLSYCQRRNIWLVLCKYALVTTVVRTITLSAIPSYTTPSGVRIFSLNSVISSFLSAGVIRTIPNLQSFHRRYSQVRNNCRSRKKRNSPR